jgi:hypothetical protein
MTKAKLGTFDDLVAELPEEIETIARAARKQILEVHPDAVEIVRLGYRTATYGFGSKMSEGYTFVSPQTAYVNLGFPFGTSLFDPQRLLEGTGRNMRHVKLRSVAGVTRSRKLVAAALEERRNALGLT